MKLITVFAVIAALDGVAVKPPRYVIPERVIDGAVICATYTSASAPRQPNRACVDMREVKAWILKNGRPADDCSE